MRNKYTNYKNLSKKGDVGENLFVTFLVNNAFENVIHVDDTSDHRSTYDIKATKDGLVHKFEVKTQDECHKYGTVNVEQVQNGKLAGISTSEADWWVFYNPHLGFGFIEAYKLKTIHRKLTKNSTMLNYRKKDTVEGYKLWKTDFINFAAGFRLPNNELKWHKV